LKDLNKNHHEEQEEHEGNPRNTGLKLEKGFTLWVIAKTRDDLI
jgi:hypothetical protein